MRSFLLPLLPLLALGQAVPKRPTYYNPLNLDYGYAPLPAGGCSLDPARPHVVALAAQPHGRAKSTVYFSAAQPSG